MSHPIRIEIFAKSKVCHARKGRVHTPHGWFQTPAFMPVGTRGTVKGVFPEMLAQTGSEICLGNTYHLMLRPGSDLVSRVWGAEGLHGMMRWDRPILTDSGGYQAFSMADLNKVTDDGVRFKSIVDGAMIDMSPEVATKVQNELGADIMMAFDDCPPSAQGGSEQADDGDERLKRVLRRDGVDDAQEYAKRVSVANERTVRWLERCIAAHQRKADQGLFGIVQGGTIDEERVWSAERITQFDLPGFAIGGVAVGETTSQIARVVELVAPLLPWDKPRYLMGVGYERDILTAVRSGVDMFDCVLPTRNARNANAFTPRGQIRLRNAKFAQDGQVLWPGCDCHGCAHGYCRAYLRHLFSVGEMLGPMLVSLHNIRHFQRFMADIRCTIETDDWSGLIARWPVASGASGS